MLGGRIDTSPPPPILKAIPWNPCSPASYANDGIRITLANFVIVAVLRIVGRGSVCCVHS